MLEDWAGNLKSFDNASVCNPPETGDSLQLVLAEDVLILIREAIFPGMKPNPLQHNHSPGILPIRVVKVVVEHEFTFDREATLGYPSGLDEAGRGGSQPGESPFRYTVRGIDGTKVGGFDHVFVDHIYGTLLCFEDILQRVFGLGRTAGETDYDDGGVVVDHLGVTEGRQIGGLAVGGDGTYESNRTGDNPRDHNTVVIDGILPTNRQFYAV
jgi:hypothetical protein